MTKRSQSGIKYNALLSLLALVCTFAISNAQEFLCAQTCPLFVAPTSVLSLNASSLPNTITTLAIHPLHDAHIVYAIDGQIQFILELERLFDIRYYSPSETMTLQQFEDRWNYIFDFIRPLINQVDHVVITRDRWRWDDQWPVIAATLQRKSLLPKFVTELHHHRAHAIGSFYDSSFSRALVFSYDGGGSDGFWHIFYMDRITSNKSVNLIHLQQIDINLGISYAAFGAIIPDVAGSRAPPRDELLIQRDVCPLKPFWNVMPLSLAGKLMGYSALGKVRQHWLAPIRQMYRTKALMQSRPTIANYSCWIDHGKCYLRDLLATELAAPLGIKLNDEGYLIDNELAKDLAATNQQVFTELLMATFNQWIRRYTAPTAAVVADGGSAGQIDGVVLTGGAALNVLANQALRRAFPTLPVYVAAAPSDCGLGMGLVWWISPPPVAHASHTSLLEQSVEDKAAYFRSHPSHQPPLAALPFHPPITYLGFPLWDLQSLSWFANHYNAKLVTTHDQIVKLLIDERAIVGVARGRQEVGPRALGHRSLLAYPADMNMKAKLNRLKAREWYRPVAPVVTLEGLHMFVEEADVAPSPYMSFSHTLTDEAKQLFPAITHYDGSARIQTVTNEQEQWLHSLLVAIQQRTGFGILMNTSFNTKGRPLVNKISHIMEMLRDLPDLDYVLIENWLFDKQTVTQLYHHIL